MLSIINCRITSNNNFDFSISVVHSFIYLSSVLRFFDRTVVRTIIMVSIRIYPINPLVLVKCIGFTNTRMVRCVEESQIIYDIPLYTYMMNYTSEKKFLISSIICMYFSLINYVNVRLLGIIIVSYTKSVKY